MPTFAPFGDYTGITTTINATSVGELNTALDNLLALLPEAIDLSASPQPEHYASLPHPDFAKGITAEAGERIRAEIVAIQAAITAASA